MSLHFILIAKKGELRSGLSTLKGLTASRVDKPQDLANVYLYGGEAVFVVTASDQIEAFAPILPRDDMQKLFLRYYDHLCLQILE